MEVQTHPPFPRRIWPTNLPFPTLPYPTLPYPTHACSRLNDAFRGVNVGGWFTPQRNDTVGLKLSAVGLKIMRLFTRGALRSKLNI
jgi:hypothetical protein